MKRQLHALLALWTSLAVAVTGCAPTQPFFFFEDGDLSHYVGMATAIEHPDVETCSLAEVEHAGQPITVTDPAYREIWELSLQDAVRYALENSKVMRAIGGRQSGFGGGRDQFDNAPDELLRAPQQAKTVYDPAIIESDPIFGVEGALSAFDAQLGSQLFWEKNDRPQNVDISRNPNLQTFGFDRVRRQDLGQFNATLSKRLATGGRAAVAANSIYEFSNSGVRELTSDWTQNFEAQFSQPLLQGGGIFFNRIAGPFDPFQGAGTPNFDGVVLARIRTDISLADFEAGVRNLVNDVEGAYWNLYFAYRNLEARKVGRDSALATWRKVYALYVVQAKGGESDKEAQAREQYFFFRAEVETAYSDMLRAESRLRYIMGLAATDGRLIAPITEPTIARVTFDWNEIHAESLTRNVELRQQRWRIKQRELELMASKNLLLPRLDLVARHRWLGLGDDLIDSNGRGYTASNTDTLTDSDAFSTIFDGSFQESQIGFQFNMPLGFRRELATVRQQQLFVARERFVLQEQELELSHQLTEAVRVMDTAYVLLQSNFNRAVAARRQVEALTAAYDVGTITLDLLLDAQRRLADALQAGYRSQADYNRNIAQVHFRKGSLLEYNGVYLAEGPWPAKAYFAAQRRARARDAAYFLDYGFTRPDVVSLGPADQHHAGGTVHEGAIHQGDVWREGLPIPVEGQPTPARPAAPAEAPSGGEELPSPGPASVKPQVDGPRLSSVGRTGVRQASFESDAPLTPAVTGNGVFDWNLNGGVRSVEAKTAGESPPAIVAQEANVTRLRLTDEGSSDVSSRNSDAKGSMNQASASASGWKAKR